MRKLLLIFVLLIGIAFGQYQNDTMYVDIIIPAPQEVIDQVDTLRCFFESRPMGQQMLLYSGMQLAEAEALSGELLATFDTDFLSFNYIFPANGYSFNFAVFGIDFNGEEVIHQIGYDRYYLKSGLAYGTLPLISDTTDHQIYINVEVNFQ